MLNRNVLCMATAVMVLCSSVACSRAEPGHLDCSEQEEAEVDALAQLPILEVSPPSAQAGDAFSGCGRDDSGDPIEPHAGRRYRSTLSEAQIRSFYWAELARDGWRDASTVIPPGIAPSVAFQRGISCLVKNLSGTQVRFDIHFDPAPGTSPSPSAGPPKGYAIQLAARTGREDDGCR